VTADRLVDPGARSRRWPCRPPQRPQDKEIHRGARREGTVALLAKCQSSATGVAVCRMTRRPIRASRYLTRATYYCRDGCLYCGKVKWSVCHARNLLLDTSYRGPGWCLGTGCGGAISGSCRVAWRRWARRCRVARWLARRRVASWLLLARRYFHWAAGGLLRAAASLLRATARLLPATAGVLRPSGVLPASRLLAGRREPVAQANGSHSWPPIGKRDRRLSRARTTRPDRRHGASDTAAW
jgi:hypothetical protein